MILVVVAAKQIYLLNLIPPWQIPDEPAHFQYVQTLAEEHRAPVFSVAERDVSEELRASFYQIQNRLKGPGKEHLPPSLYPDHLGIPVRDSAPAEQPVRSLAGAYGPVYYLVATVPYYLFYTSPIETRLLAVRALSSLSLLVVVWLAYRIGRRVRGSGFGLALAAMIGFMPMLGYLAVGVNNDIFLLLFSALVFDRLSRGLTSLFTWRDIVWLGVWTGLAAMTKQQGWVLVVATTLGLFFQRRQLGWRRVSKMLGTFFVLALIIGASWGARGLIVDQNNFISGEGLSAANHRTKALPLENDAIVSRIFLSRLPSVFVTFWGFFGWNGVATTFPWRLYHGLGVLGVMTLVGVGIARQRLRASVAGQWLTLSLFSWAFLELLFVVIFWQRAATYGVVSFPNQGRYYFFLLIPIMSAVLLAGESLVTPRLRAWAWVGVVGGMVGLCVWSIWPVLTTLYG